MKSFTPSKLIVVVYGKFSNKRIFRPEGPNKVAPLIEKTCRATPHYDLRVKADIKGLLQILARELTDQGSGTWKKIHQMYQKITDPRLQKLYVTCLAAYSTITEDISYAYRGLIYDNHRQIIDGLSL